MLYAEIIPKITWEIMARTKSQNSKGENCKSHLLEKFPILKIEPNLLNKINRLMTTSRQKSDDF